MALARQTDILSLRNSLSSRYSNLLSVNLQKVPISLQYSDPSQDFINKDQTDFFKSIHSHVGGHKLV